MKSYRLDQLRQIVERHFDERSVQTVIGWFKANEGRRPVVVVGAGFTRNAIDTRTGKPARPPLWSDVLDPLAADLGVDRRSYDAPTLAELYYEEFGGNALHNRLLHLVEDKYFGPGTAHRALFGYSAESIITTNLFDTVLDRGPSYIKSVIQDSDLALYELDGNTTQVIYFHGHRTNCESWIFTRAQYEDILKTKPLIVTRVRQLLSQYPVLAVGYSLSDPDFHHIYRQISLDMANRHPMGLAILLTEPNAAERRHWESLGLRIAVLKSPDGASDAFTAFFEYDPTSLPALPDVGSLKHVLVHLDGFEKRTGYLQDIWGDDDTRRSEVASYTSPYNDYDSYALWLACIEREVPKEEEYKIEPLRKPRTRQKTGGESSKNEGLPESDSPRDFSRLPPERFSSEWRFARIVDVLLTCSAELAEPLARWIKVGIERGLVDSDHAASDANYLDLLSWLWRRIVEKGPKRSVDARNKSEAHVAIAMCRERAARYGFGQILKWLDEDAEALNSEGERPAADGNGAPVVESFSELTRLMQIGFSEATNGRREAAYEAYKQAAKLAEEQKDAFGYWVALNGQFQYVYPDWESYSDPRKQEQFQLLRQLIRRAEREPAVLRWTRRSQERLRELEQDTIKKLKERERQRAFPSNGLSFNNYAHNAWRSFRDLEVLYAAPSEQVKYLKPLLDYDAYSGSRDEELAYRLKFDIDKTSEWIELLASRTLESVAQQREFDRKLVDVLKKDSLSTTERRARLRALPELIDAFALTDLPWAPEFLCECKRALGVEVQTYNARSLLFCDYPKAWIAYARLSLEVRTIGELKRYLATIQHPFEHEEFVGRLARLPWESWLACSVAPPDELAEFIFSCVPTEDSDGSLSKMDYGVGWSLYEVVLFAREFERGPLGEALVQRARAWASGALKKANPHDYQWYAYRAPVHLGWILSEGDEDVRTRHIDEVLALIERSGHSSGEDERAGMRTTAALLADLLDLGVPVERTRPNIGALWRRVEDGWEKIKASLELNPHMISPYDFFLVLGIATNALPDLPSARIKLLELVKLSPNVLPRLACILDPVHWGNEWSSLVDHIWLTVGGYRGDEAMSRLHSALSLWLNVVNQRRAPRPLPEDLSVLVDVGLLGVSNESHLVANSAAYGVVRYAERADLGLRLRPVMAALRNIADDPRVMVRHGAAYGAGWLAKNAAHEEIRALAHEIGDKLKDDPSAWVQRQLRFGAAKAEARRQGVIGAGR